jgi:predicted dehydrogenase
MRLWIEALREDKKPVVTAEQALVVSQILEAIYISSESGEAYEF